MAIRLFHVLLGVGVFAAAACGSNTAGPGSLFDAGTDGGSVGHSDAHRDGKGGGDGGHLTTPDGTVLHPGDPDAAVAFDVTPTGLTTITVPVGATSPTATFKATVDGVAANAGWGVDRGDIGSVPPGPSSSAVFTPTGTTGGVVTLTASAAGKTLTRKILVKLTAKQNGPTSNPAETAQVPTTVGQLSAGGGVDGVGGEGLGVAVTDPTALAALANPSADASGLGLTLLYPYDKTVWPRGMLAPLLMWSWTPGDADAIQIQLATASGSFSWTGTFGRPAILSMQMAPNNTNFIRMPIPQDIWDIATNTAGAPDTMGNPDPLVVKLTVEKAGVAAGPVTETWPVAPGRLTGSVYYNSYATQLVKNWGANRDAAGNAIGAAVLGIRSGDTGPTLVVGENSANDDSGCRVCHVVSSRGRWLLTQSEQGSPGDGQSYLYDLTAAAGDGGVQGSAVAIPQQGTFGWAAMTSDGSYALTNEVNPSSSNPAIGTSTSTFWQFGPAPVAATLTGLPAGVAAGYPQFSADDSLVAYVDATSNTADLQGPIVTASYAPSTQLFSNVQTVVPAPMTGQRIGYPVFLPNNGGILFETEVRASCTDSVMVTRNGARSELWWVSLAAGSTPVRLDTLNGIAGGTSYLPTGPNNHGGGTVSDPQNCGADESTYDDTTLSYEPTILPLVAGGYAWVVFTSRRLYGNQLTYTPWESWPQDYDTTSLPQATVKKLWVAAIDLSDPASSDISHPAFYLPAQEILAGNSRGFWVLDPCKPDGQSCQTGDQCCNGYCEADGDGGALVCANTTPKSCSLVQEKCTSAADCCDTTDTCTAGFCAAPTTK